jgi:hypothetical protein
MNILEGLTLEQALGCLCDSDEGTMLVISKKIHACPNRIGIKCPECGHNCRACWESALTKHFDAQKASKWVEPKIAGYECSWPGFAECSYIRLGTEEHEAEIARTNARREIEAFIRANGGPGKIGSYYCIYWNSFQSTFETGCGTGGYAYIGLIACATRDLADEVIRRFPSQLRLLAGVK